MKGLTRPWTLRTACVLSMLGLVAWLLSFSRTAAQQKEETVAFLRLSGDFWQIWLMNLDGSDARQLTTSPLDKHSPSWCPGNEVLHYYNDAGVAMLVEVNTGREEMQSPLIPRVPGPRTMDGRRLVLPEEAQRRLDPHAKERLVCGDPTSPRAETLTLYELDTPPGHALAIQRRQVSDPELLFDMKVIDLERPSDIGTFGATNIRSDARRVVSSSGQTVVVRKESNASEISLRGPNGKSEPLTRFDTVTDHPAWSNDGEWLLFDSKVQGTEQIFRVNVGSRDVIERITDGVTPSKHPVIRPAGEIGE